MQSVLAGAVAGIVIGVLIFVTVAVLGVLYAASHRGMSRYPILSYYESFIKWFFLVTLLVLFSGRLFESTFESTFDYSAC